MTTGTEPLVTEPTLPLVQYDGPEADDLEMAPAQFEADAIRRNWMWLYQRRQAGFESALLAEMSTAIYGSPDAWMERQESGDVDTSDFTSGAYQSDTSIETNPRTRAFESMFTDAARIRETMPGEMANFPTTWDELHNQAGATAVRELERELAEAEATLGNRSDPTVLGGLASFTGSMAAGVSDIEGLVTLPFGAGAGSLARIVLWESALGAASGALDLPSQYAQAERLGLEAPDPVQQILMGASFGALLPLGGRVLGVGVNSLTEAGRIRNSELLGYARRDGATEAERGAAAMLGREEATYDTVPDGADPEVHAGRAEAAEAALQDDMTVRPGDVIPDMSEAGGRSGRTGEAPVFDYEPGGNAAPDANLVGYTLGKLIDRGMDPHIAMGFVGNFMAESGKGLNTGAIGDGGNAIGIAQWNGARKRALMRFAEARGTDWRDIDTQIDFLFSELEGPEYAAYQTILRADDPAEAAFLVSEHFERPGVKHMSTRMAYGRMLGEQWDRGEVPKGGAPGRWREPGDDALAGEVLSFNPRDVGFDPLAYQYKSGGDDYGVTDRLRGEREWDARAAVGVIVHERMDGTRFIADGHQRLGLARRLMDQGQDGITLQGFLLREIDGFGVEEVRALAALRNIRQESGTALDAAKIIRDNPELTSMISRGRPFMAQAQALADLAPGPFQAIVNEVIPQNWGAIVGRIIPDDDRLQGVAIAALKKADPANETQAESITRDIRRLGLEKQAEEAQLDLFGDGFDLRQTVITERARIIDRVIREARTDRALFSRLEREADAIQEAGNVLNRSENLSRAEAAERALARLLILADQPGPVRDALDQAARDLRGGTAIDDAARTVRKALEPGAGARDAVAAADRTADGGPASAPLTPPNPLDLPADGGGRIEPGLFDDLESPGEAARLDALDRDLAARLAAEPRFDLVLPTGDAEAPSLSLRAIWDDLAEEADFADALKTICLTKGS
jgi:hypothetical protein